MIKKTVGRESSESKEKKPAKLKGRFIALGVSVLLLATLCILKTNTAVCEFFARTFSRGWVWFFGHIFGWIPISFYELMLLAAFVGVILALVKIIISLKRREGRRALKIVVTLAIVCLGFASVYTATASMCYNRNLIPLATENFTVSNEELRATCEYYVDKLNEVNARLERDKDGIVKNPYSTKELGDKLREDFKILDEFDGFFSKFTPQSKGMAASVVMSALSLTGITFVPFGEPNVNTQNPACDLPHTMAHEIAHSKGVMREYEANIVANYVCLTSSDDFILYSGLTNTIYSLLSLYNTQTGDSSGQDELYARIDDDISEESFAVFAFWINKGSFLSRVSNWFNNLYLKLNGQSGTGSYTEPPIVVVPVEPGPIEPPIKVVSYTQTQRILIELFRAGV